MIPYILCFEYFGIFCPGIFLIKIYFRCYILSSIFCLVSFVRYILSGLFCPDTFFRVYIVRIYFVRYILSRLFCPVVNTINMIKYTTIFLTDIFTTFHKTHGNIGYTIFPTEVLPATCLISIAVNTIIMKFKANYTATRNGSVDDDDYYYYYYYIYLLRAIVIRHV